MKETAAFGHASRNQASPTLQDVELVTAQGFTGADSTMMISEGDDVDPGDTNSFIDPRLPVGNDLGHAEDNDEEKDDGSSDKRSQ